MNHGSVSIGGDYETGVSFGGRAGWSGATTGQRNDMFGDFHVGLIVSVETGYSSDFTEPFKKFVVSSSH